MTHPVATFESVFTPEYWQPIPDQTTSISLADIVRIQRAQRASRENVNLARENLTLAVSQLIEDKPTDIITQGELVGGPDDTRYALPGAVLLIDEEWVVLGKRQVPTDEYRGRISSEAELSRSAVATFMASRGSTKFNNAPNYATYNEYHGRLISPQGIYKRTVSIYAYYASKRGGTAVLGMIQWRNEPGGPEVIAPTGMLRNMPFIVSGRVGETNNATLRPDTPAFNRIREVHLCLRGIAETQKVKARSKVSLQLKCSLNFVLIRDSSLDYDKSMADKILY